MQIVAVAGIVVVRCRNDKSWTCSSFQDWDKNSIDQTGSCVGVVLLEIRSRTFRATMKLVRSEDDV